MDLGEERRMEERDMGMIEFNEVKCEKCNCRYNKRFIFEEDKWLCSDCLKCLPKIDSGLRKDIWA